MRSTSSLSNLAPTAAAVAMALSYAADSAATAASSTHYVQTPIFHAADRALPEAAHEAWEATVLVETRWWKTGAGFPDAEEGTALIIGHDATERTIWAATSSHVVPCSARCLIRIHLPRKTTGHVAVEAELQWRDSQRDLALLRAKVPKKARIRVARVDSNRGDASNADVLAIGFPDLGLLPRNQRPRISASPSKRYSTGRLIGSLEDFSADVFSYGSVAATGRLLIVHGLTHDAALLPGSSGGPLIDDRGFVLGINIGSLTSRTNESCARAREQCHLHLAVPIDELLATMKGLMEAR